MAELRKKITNKHVKVEPARGMMQPGTNLWADARRMALKVDFLETKEEFRLYATALLDAMRWGEKQKR